MLSCYSCYSCDFYQVFFVAMKVLVTFAIFADFVSLDFCIQFLSNMFLLQLSILVEFVILAIFAIIFLLYISDNSFLKSFFAKIAKTIC